VGGLHSGRPPPPRLGWAPDWLNDRRSRLGLEKYSGTHIAFCQSGADGKTAKRTRDNSPAPSVEIKAA
jgi:hypothetical protein